MSNSGDDATMADISRQAEEHDGREAQMIERYYNALDKGTVLDMLKRAHKAIDSLMARLIEADNSFLPTKSPEWADIHAVCDMLLKTGRL